MSKESWLETDRQAVGFALERLFVAQDKRLTEDHKTVLIEELEATSLGVRQIITAIEKLKRDNLASIKAWTIIEAARALTEPESVAVGPCNSCHRGIVLMRDPNRYQFMLRCNCVNGEATSLSDLAMWNGQNVQYRHGRTLTKEF